MVELSDKWIAWLALLVSAISLANTYYHNRSVDKGLESSELRKKKIETVYKLLGSRYVLRTDYPASSEEVSVFNTALALFPIYFSDQPDALRAYDKFLSQSNIENFVELMEIAGKSVNVKSPNSVMTNVFTHPPTIIIPVVQNQGQKHHV